MCNAFGAATGGLLSARRGLAAPAAAAASAVAAAPADAAKVVTKAHGFTLQRQQFVKEYGSTVLLYKHDKTGAYGRQRVRRGGLPRSGKVADGSSRPREEGTMGGAGAPAREADYLDRRGGAVASCCPDKSKPACRYD